MVELPIRRFIPDGPGDAEAILARQWLVANGLGGYSSGTIGSVNTWHYHGLLVSAEAAPLGRMMMLGQMIEQLHLADGSCHMISGEERHAGGLDMPAAHHLVEFRLEGGLPTWKYRIGPVEFERSVIMPRRQNTVYLFYRVLKAEQPVKFELRPGIWFRPHEATFDRLSTQRPYFLTVSGNRYEIHSSSDVPNLKLSVQAERATFVTDGGSPRDAFYRRDAERGYDARGQYWTPGHFIVELSAGQEAAVVASTESWNTILAMKPAEASMLEKERRSRLIALAPEHLRTGFPAELLLAADSFLFEPASRFRERVRALATGEQVRAVIAGYHWFTDWGRDTLISLEGLTLVTGRADEAKAILTAYNRYIRDGLLPNLFPDGAEEAVYHTADATLWFFHAIDRYLSYTGDRATLQLLLPQLIGIAEAHKRGTRFGIRIDDDGLMQQGEDGYQLTWMDAKVDGWVVTPRRGKAVELNGLWYNALMLLTEWISEEMGEEKAAPWREDAEKARRSFNDRFWYEEGDYLYDIVDGEAGNDTALRPNQLLSFSLRHKVLDEKRWEPVLRKVQQKLLTPLGLRTLSPDHPDYKHQYFGDLRARDAAYHQGTVWPWLLGPYVDAWLTVYPDAKSEARKLLDAFIPHLDEGCIGSINEICDAEAPFAPRGCISQAWSVAEVLRCWSNTEPVEASTI